MSKESRDSALASNSTYYDTNKGKEQMISDHTFPHWVEEIYKGEHGFIGTTSWHDMPHVYNYNWPKIVIPKVPKDMHVIEQWNFVFREFAKSTTIALPKSYDIEEAKKKFNIE